MQNIFYVGTTYVFHTLKNILMLDTELEHLLLILQNLTRGTQNCAILFKFKLEN